ncbi:glucosaminidase domain-containing protein [Proteinivorax hydrogeniformans]|uniref:Glucosaminidase domain-containing protein n=1 Tax=Proteinivorax hydrogeniformans TaxID=1826727 RepID=A0AAU8HU92_9FIRM
MESIKRTFFMGVMIVLILSIANVQFFNLIYAQEVTNYEGTTKAFEKTASLESQLQRLLDESSQYIKYLDQVYEDQYDKDLKLVYNHITYSDRLVARNDNFLKNSTKAVSANHGAANLNLTNRSAITAYEIDNFILKGTPLEGLGSAFIQAEIEHGVNAFFLLALAVHESGWGRSDIARDKNNLFGYGAYDKNPYKYARAFSTKEEGIDTVARHLARNYLTPGARYYSGGFTLKHVNNRYASDPHWHLKIARSMDRFNQDIINRQNTSYHETLYKQGE